jgi:hypothetical protein
MTALVGSIFNSGLLPATGATATLTSGSTTTGNAIVVWGWIEGVTTGYTAMTISDSGNTWSIGTARNNANRSCFVGVAFGITSGGVRTITCTFTGGSGNVAGEMFGGEFSGGLIAFDQSGSSLGFSVSPAVATAGGADTGTDNLVLAAFSSGTGGASGISSPCTGGAAWSVGGVNQDDSANAAGQTSYRINTASVTDAPSWTFSTPLVNGAAAAVWSINTAAVAGQSAVSPMPFYNTVFIQE